MNTYIITSLLFSCGLPMLLIAGILAFIYHVTRKGSSVNTEPKNGFFLDWNSRARSIPVKALKSWLEEQSVKGIRDISGLLQELETPQPISAQLQKHELPAKNIVKNSFINLRVESGNETEASKGARKPTVETLDEKSNESGIFNLSSGYLLLYLGAFITCFGLFILVAFSWASFSDFVKNSLLIITTLAFFGVGFGLRSSERLKPAASMFVTVGCLAMAFTGIGLWTFGVESYEVLTFSQYWLVYSVFLNLTILAVAYVFGQQRFKYLLLIGIYSSMASMAFTLTLDNRFRIVLMAMLNLVFYLPSALYGSNQKLVVNASRIVNRVLDIFIILTLIGLLSDINDLQTRTTAISAMLIPVLYDLVVYTRGHGRLDLAASIMLGVTKLGIVANIFRLQNEFILLMYGLYGGILVVTAEYRKGNMGRVIKYSSMVTGYLTLAFASLFLLINIYDPTVLLIPKWYEFVLLLAIPALITGLQWLKGRFYALYPLLLLFIPVTLRCLHILGLNREFDLYVLLVIAVISVIALAMNIKNEIVMKKYFSVPLYLVSLLVALVISNSDLDYLVTFSVISLSLYALYEIVREERLRYFYILPSLFAWHYLVEVVRKEWSVDISLEVRGMMYLIPAILYWIWMEYRFKSLKSYWSELVAVAMFAFVGFTYAWDESAYGLSVLIFALLVAVYMAFRAKKVPAIYVGFGLLVPILWYLGDLFKISSEARILLVAVVNSMIAILLYANRNAMMRDFVFDAVEAANKSVSVLALGLFGMFIYGGFALDSHELALAMILGGYALYLSAKDGSDLQYFSGMGFVLAAWNYANMYDRGIQFYTLPFVTYLLSLSFIKYSQEKRDNGFILEMLGYGVGLGGLLLHSLIGSSGERITAGLALITIGVFVGIWGLYRKENRILWFALGFVMLELIIRLYFIIFIIPWWLYLALFGIALMSLALYVFWKSPGQRE